MRTSSAAIVSIIQHALAVRRATSFLTIQLGLVMALIVSSCGCQTMNSELASLFGDPPAASAPEPEKTADESPTFYVELRESGKKPELMKLPLPETMYVQQALDQSGASRRFRRMKIQLYRHLPGGGGHRLDIAYDRTTRKVPAGSDYALHAKDRLVVTEDTSTVLDDMLGGISAPISKAVAR